MKKPDMDTKDQPGIIRGNIFCGFIARARGLSRAHAREGSPFITTVMSGPVWLEKTSERSEVFYIEKPMIIYHGRFLLNRLNPKYLVLGDCRIIVKNRLKVGSQCF